MAVARAGRTGRRLATVLLLMLGGCGPDATPLIAYRDPLDALRSLSPFGPPPCVVRDASGMLASLPVDRCMWMRKPERLKGIWLDEFEGSRFFEGATTAAQAIRQVCGRPRGRGPWGEWLEEGRWPSPPLEPGEGRARLIRLEFVGRRTAYPGSYGHFGGSRSLVLADRLSKAEVIFTSTEPYLTDQFCPRR